MNVRKTVQLDRSTNKEKKPKQNMILNVIKVDPNINNNDQSSPSLAKTTTTTTRAVMREKLAIETRYKAIWAPKFNTMKLLSLVSLLLFVATQQLAEAFYHQLPPLGLDAGASGNRPNEYQLIGEAGHQIRLPCLIGEPLYCGEPYFIAWYKLNVSSKSWIRFEHRSMEDNELAADPIEISSSNRLAGGQSLADRVRFDWSASRSSSQSQSAATKQSATKSANNFKSSICSDPAAIFQSSSSSAAAINSGPTRQRFLLDQSNFDCAQLTISPLDLSDEGQYKCEITFSESLDFDKCPATTLSQLTVIARPNEPELLVNGRKTASPDSGASNWAFREGAQVRLECQSSGGRPAPRIEWLNLSDTSEQVHLMRDFWPQKRTSFLQQDSNVPVTSSSLTVSLSRFDLHNQFVCLVLPQQFRGQQQQQQQLAPAAHYSLEQLVKNPAHLARMLKAGSLANGQQQQQQQQGLMFKRIKLDVQVRPSSVSLIVRDVYSSSSLLEPVQFVGLESASGQSVPPFYSLQLNRLYAIQCRVDQSRPRSRVNWFNRTTPIATEPIDLSDASTQSTASSSPPSPYFIVPNELAQLNSMMRPNYNNPPHRVSSYVRHELLPDGTTFRTTATLLLTTSLWDNFEELSCKISNEAFASEELPQAAAIRLFVNYAPFAWLEPDSTRMNQQQIDWPSAKVVRVNALAQESVALRCSVAANPLGQNTILQIEWFKDGRKLSQPSSHISAATSSNGGGGGSSKQQATISRSTSRLLIERANHLHMPQAAAAAASTTSGRGGGVGGAGNQLAPGSKLTGSSWLSIGAPLNKSDSGNYTCQFKLIPAPPTSGSGGVQTTHPNQSPARNEVVRITSGQANQTVQVNVIEAKPGAPTIGISSARGAFVYWLASDNSDKEQEDAAASEDDDHDHDHDHGGRAAKASRKILRQTAVLDSLDSQLSFSCEMPNQHQHPHQHQQRPHEEATGGGGGGSAQLEAHLAGHKALWYVNNQLLKSSQPRDILNTTLRLLGFGSKLASLEITCAHQTLSLTNQQGLAGSVFHAANSVRILQSTNAIDLRLKVGPRLLERRELLMPQTRSFSELELNANPTNKLRLACLAQCEPLCSIEWYLNQEPLASAAVSQADNPAATGAAANKRAAAARGITAAEAATLTTTMNQTATVVGAGFVLRQELLAANPAWFRLVSIENVLHHQQQQSAPADAPLVVVGSQRNGTSSRFAWLRQSSLGAAAAAAAAPVTGGHPSIIQQQQQLDWQGRQLMREASEQQYLPDQVNVFSRLELSYNSIARLLEAAGSQNDPEYHRESAIKLKCRINPIFDSSNFEQVFLAPNQWLNNPPAAATSEKRTNLSLLFSETGARGQNGGEQNGYSLPGGERRLSFVDEMQINILLDKAPASISIRFAGISSSDLEPNGVTLSESQLIELVDPNKMAPLLQCKVLDHSQLPTTTKFKWTFIDWNNTELTLGEGAQQLNLRRLIELRQSQLLAEPMSAMGLDVILSSIVGNYTCTASNIHGSKSATLPIRVQGRPICKLALANQFLGPENELFANLRCTIYSVPSLMETIWLRNEQQISNRIGVNRSSSVGTGQGDYHSYPSSGAMVSMVDLPVMVLNRQQEFLLADLLEPSGGTFKCIARNSFGFSEACELSQANKQMLLNTLRPFENGIGGGGAVKGSKNPALSMVLFQADSHSKQSISSLMATNQTASYNNNNNSNNNNNNIGTGGASAANQSQAEKGLSSMFRLNNLLRIDWLVIICCSLAGLWLLFILSSTFARRSRFKLSSTNGGSGSNGSPRDRNHHTSWRFNSSSRSNSNNEIVGVPFQGSKVCVNYYGGSNNDSEHEMIQSGSQSSHYEDFIQHQLQLKQQQQQQQQQQQLQQQQQKQRLISQPVYLNGLSTLNRPTMKSSLSSSSTCDSSTNSRLGVKKLLPSQTVVRSEHLVAGPAAGSSFLSQNQHPPASTMRESFGGGSFTAGGTNSVPLVNGINNSRVNLDYQQQQQQQYQPRLFRGASNNNNPEQQQYGHQIRNEHIYDDVIYNQMIL